MPTARIVHLRQGLLKQNDLVAAGLRTRFGEAGLVAVNLVSGPGAGKTAWLERTLGTLRQAGARVAAVVGDPETDQDARRLSRSGAPVRQIETRGVCHLDAAMVRDALEGWDLDTLDYLFIENVGNLVCTTSFDLGETLRVVVLSVTEGEDKPLKYPGLFHSADLALVSKVDLAEPCQFDREAALKHLRGVRPGLPVIETSAKTGRGMDAWLEALAACRPRREPG